MSKNNAFLKTNNLLKINRFLKNKQPFLKYRKLYMPKTLPFEIPPERGFMIDTEFEFEIASLLAKNKVIPTS